MAFRKSIIGAAITTLALVGAMTPVTANDGSEAALNAETMVSNTGDVLRPTAREAAGGGGGGSFKGTDAGGESVIGSDGRSQVNPTTSYPSRAVVLITRNGSSNTQHCSAAFVAKDTLLTAGHCVHTGGSGGTWYSGLRFWPARNGRTVPYPYCTAKKLWSITGWTQSKSEQHDIGVVKLACTTGNQTGWFGWFWQTASEKGYPATVRGYPGDKPAYTMWTMNGTLAESQQYQNFYSIDTFGGQSGSPVFQNRASGSLYCSGYCIHTNHSYGVHGSYPHTLNHGRRITEAVHNLIKSVRDNP